MRIRLSYDLASATPVAAGLPPVRVRRQRSIEAGDEANWSTIEMCSHSGTHVDAPWHFNQQGKRLTDLPIGFFFFERPLLLDLTKGDAELVIADDLEPHAARIRGCDLLLLRTGFSVHRCTDPDRYILKSPGLSLSAAECLSRFPDLRGVALDTISVASYEHLQEGLEAHRILFRDVDLPRILVEDVNLASDLEKVKSVTVLPLFFESLDGAPCTVVAEV